MMKQQPIPIAKAYRQYRHLAKRLSKSMATGEWTGLSLAQRQRQIERLRHLYRTLAGSHSRRHLRRLLASAVVLLGLSSQGQAQVSFAPAVTNPFGLTPSADNRTPTYVDIDDDGDLDLFTGQYFSGNTVTFYENTGTAAAPAFAAPVDNPFGLTGGLFASVLDFADFDNDGDQDVMMGEYYGNFLYFENTGTAAAPSFAAPQTNPFGLTASYYYNLPTAVDLDGDGDFDLMVGNLNDEFQYYENTGTPGTPAFGAPITNPFGLTSTLSTYQTTAFADIDLDGDLDLFSGGYGNLGQINFFENIGTSTAPAFGPLQTNPFSLTSTTYYALVATADLDDDGDSDLLVSEYYGAFQYFENVSMLSVNAPPDLGALVDTVVCTGDTLNGYPISASDADGDPLTVFASSSDPVVVPSANLTVTGTAPTFALQIIPATGQTGTVDITVSVTDGTDTTSSTFMLDVINCNTAPSFTPVDSQTVCLGDPFGPLAITAADPDGDPLTLTASSSDQAIVPDGDLSISGMAPSFTLDVATLGGNTGSVDITLVADDGDLSDTTTFVLTVEDCNQAPIIGVIDDLTLCFGQDNDLAADVPVTDPDGDDITLTVTSDNPAVLPTPGITVSGTMSPFQVDPGVPLSPGTATMTVIADDGALQDTATFQVTAEVCTQIAEPSALAGLELFPNPAQDQVVVRLPRMTRIESWHLFSLQGSSVQGWAAGQLTDTHTLSLKGIPAGVYLLEVQTDEGRAMRRLIVE